MEEDTILCNCSGTRVSQVVTRYRQGLTTLEALSDATGIVSGCGGCEWDLCALLETLAATENAIAPSNETLECPTELNETP